MDAEPGNLTTTPVTGALVASRPGRYRLRVAATDVAGRSGSADYELVAELVPAGPLSVSSLVLGLSRSGTFTPRMEFGAEPVALGYVEIYGRGRVRRVGRGGSRAVGEGPAIGPRSRRHQSHRGQDRFIATVAVPIGGLARRLCRPRERRRCGQPAGRVMRTLRKLRV